MRYSGARREIAKIRKILNETCGLNYLSVKDANFMLDKICEALVVDEKSNGWIPVGERLPDPGKYVLVSFENLPVSMIGIYTVDDDDGGTFRISDEDDSFLEHGLYVNTWRELPERYKEDEP